MYFHKIDDWDDAYANIPNVPDGESYPDRWQATADSFRKSPPANSSIEAGISYGAADRNVYDLFLPQDASGDVMIFIHGGYWMRFDNSYFSHLATGALHNGFAVAMPSYSLCPNVRVRDITTEIAQAIVAVAKRFEGKIHLAGHSAGGHLATRMVCTDSPLPKDVQHRIDGVMSISGVHDLRSLLQLEINEVLKMDKAEAAAESPALHTPLPSTKLICWVGAGERSEFIRQNALLANIWKGLGASTLVVEEPDRHHMNVVDGLADPTSAMLRLLLDLPQSGQAKAI